jgi:lipid-A-disaccharide synthase
MNPSKLTIITGEASGDLLASQLVKKLKQTADCPIISAMGGAKLRDAGAEIIVDAKDLAVVGFIEVIFHFRAIYRAWKTIKQHLSTTRPDLLILVDYPGFNLRLAKAAKKMGIKVLYFISPQIWAWHYSRINIIRDNVDMMVVIFPFEEKIYQQEKIPVTFVGHPLVDVVKTTVDSTTTAKNLSLDQAKPIIGLMPGSRSGEIQRLLPVIIDSAQLIKKDKPDAQFILPVASSLDENKLKQQLTKANLPIQLIKEQQYDALQLCDVVIVASGTATLELALLNIPMVIIYKTQWLTYQLAKCLAKVSYIGLCNIVAEKIVVKEFIQQQATANNISDEALNILNISAVRERIITDLITVSQKLGQHHAIQKLTDLVKKLL